MKKNTNLYHDDEIDLFNVLKIIWFEKIKILLTIIISLLIGFGYLYQTPKNYLNSLTIKSSKTIEFLKIYSVQKLSSVNYFKRTFLVKVRYIWIPFNFPSSFWFKLFKVSILFENTSTQTSAVELIK